MKETKFKQTEVGLIPSDWEVKKLGDLGEPCMCKRILKQQTSSVGDIPFYKIGTFGGEPDAYISRSVFEDFKAKYNYPKKGTLLLSAAGTIGRVVVFDGKDSYFQDSNIVWIDNDEKIVLNDFLYYCYSQMKWTTENGGTVSRLYNENLKSASFAAPKSLEEQKRIAQALSDVDAVISTTEKLIAKKKALKQGAMQTLLSGKMRIQNGKWIKTTNFKQTELGPIPQEWEVKSLGSITQNSSYGVGAEAIPFNGKVKYIRITDIDDDSHRFEPSPLTSPAFYENKHLVQENDLLIARTGASVGKTYLYNAKDGKLVFAGFLIKMNICGADSKFVFYSTLTKYYQDWIVSESARTGQPGVNLQQMKKLLVAIPSSKAEQTAIATVLSDMDTEIAALETKLAKYRQLKTGMMQQLLTGKIRLV